MELFPKVVRSQSPADKIPSCATFNNSSMSSKYLNISKSIVGKRLRKARKKLDFNKIDIAQNIGLTDSLISKIETGDAELTYTVAIAIEHTIGISSDWLLTGKGEMFMKNGKPIQYDIVDALINENRELKDELHKFKGVVAGLTDVVVKKKVRGK